MTKTGGTPIEDVKVLDRSPMSSDLFPKPEQEFTQEKIFASPFSLVFKRTKDQALTWIKVKSLRGLKNVIDRVSKGDLVPVNAHSTLDRQLWGLLAERVGFLRFGGPHVNEFNAGIQPLGSEQSEFAEDMSELFGGFEPAIEAITEMRSRVLNELEASEPTKVEGEGFLKEDGVNLTPEGEEELAKIVYDSHGDANVKVKMETANAEVLLQDSEPEIVDPLSEIRLDEDLGTITGYEAEEIGRKVEKAAAGELEDEEEVSDEETPW